MQSILLWLILLVAPAWAQDAGLPLQAEFAPGKYGEPVRLEALFQGCDIVDGVDYCAFHAEGWKHYVYRGGQTPDAWLDVLDQLPLNAPLLLHADQVSFGDITTELVLRRVAAHPQGDPYAALRAQLQGRWISQDDPQSEIEILGSEMRAIYAGEFLGLDFLQLAPRCAEAPTTATPVLLRTDPESRDPPPLCYTGIEVDADTLEWTLAGRGNRLRYQRPEACLKP